jgi:hypothetical protein
MNQPPWPTNYGRHDHAPSIWLADVKPPRAQPEPGPMSDQKRTRRFHSGPRVLLDTAKAKSMRLEGRNWRAIAAAMGCARETLIARMVEEFPDFMLMYREAPPARAMCAHSKAKKGS